MRAAIMFTDIKGYSALMHHDEAGTLKFLKEHGVVVRGIIKKFKGRVIKTIGDAFMVEFRSASNALDCGVEIQRKMAARNQGLAKAQRRNLRIGIHWGEVTLQGTDAFGDVVNIAARLEPQSSPGGVLISETLKNSVKPAKDISKLQFIPAGQRKLKNISTPVRTFQVYAPGMDKSAKLSTFVSPAKKAGRAALAAAILTGLFFWLKPSYLRWAEELRWKPLATAVFDGAQAPQGWVLDQGSNPAGPWHKLALEKAMAGQPFRMKAWLKHGGGAREEVGSQFLVPQADLQGDPKAMEKAFGRQVDGFAQMVDETLHTDGTWDVLYQNSAWKGQDNSEKRLKLFSVTKKVLPAEVQIVFSFDGDIFSYTGFDGKTRRFLKFSQASASFNDYWPSFYWQGLDLERLEISVLKKDPDLKVAIAAQQYQVAGKYDMALNLYDELVSSAANDKERCRHLYSRAATLAAMGKVVEAERAYLSLAEASPKDFFAPYALSEAITLGLDRYKTAAPDQKKGVLKEIRDRAALFARLYPGHLRATEVQNTLFALEVSFVGDLEQIFKMAKANISGDAFEIQGNVIWGVTEVLSGNSAVPKGSDLSALSAWFEGQLRDGKMDKGNLGYATHSLMKAYAVRGDWGKLLQAALIGTQQAAKAGGMEQYWETMTYLQLCAHPYSPALKAALSQFEKDPAQAQWLYHWVLDKKRFRSGQIGKAFKSRMRRFIGA